MGALARVTTDAPPIILRAAITPEEWATLRKRAIDEKVTTAQLVARLLRKGLKDGR